MDEPVTKNRWEAFRSFTRARIALGRAGSSLPTNEVLRFGVAHALARDAVHQALEATLLMAQLQENGQASIAVHSRAGDRATYLLRPDFGRRLDTASRETLAAFASAAETAFDVAFVAADGLSALAIERHFVPTLLAIRALLEPAVRVAPVIVAREARVALGDEIGALLGARLVAVLIGERPGLSSPDSLGIYLTFAPEVGRTDAERNCISNVRTEGMAYGVAARKAAWLIHEALRLQRTGIELEEKSDVPLVGLNEEAAARQLGEA